MKGKDYQHHYLICVLRRRHHDSKLRLNLSIPTCVYLTSFVTAYILVSIFVYNSEHFHALDIFQSINFGAS